VFEELGSLLPVRLTLCWAGKQAEVCAGRLRLSWKVGQTVGTIFMALFLQGSKEKRRGSVKPPRFFQNVALACVLDTVLTLYMSVTGSSADLLLCCMLHRYMQCILYVTFFAFVVQDLFNQVFPLALLAASLLLEMIHAQIIQSLTALGGCQC